MRRLVAAAVALGALWIAPSAEATINDVFGGAVTCSLQADNDRACGNSAPRSTVPTFDAVPIDVNVAFPADDGVGPDGDYPLIMMFHGYGGSKIGFGGMERFLDRGYAVFSMTDRGFHESCGNAARRTAGGAACDDGYIRLIDTRYEVRDAQYFAGLLADEDLIAPQQIGSVGGSYGGGMSMSLAALKDRMMLPDGSLVPWTSPVDGDAMRIAAATPNIPWTDLVYSLVPNGGTLDYVADSPYTGRFGVMKQSLVEGLYVTGTVTGFYAPLGTDPDADLDGLDQPPARGRALRRRPAGRRRRRRAHHAPLVLLHRRFAAARADADLERLHRRPLPGRRGDPLLPPHPRHPSGHAAGAVLRQLRPPARAEPRGRRQTCCGRARTRGSTST